MINWLLHYPSLFNGITQLFKNIFVGNCVIPYLNLNTMSIDEIIFLNKISRYNSDPLPATVSVTSENSSVHLSHLVTSQTFVYLVIIILLWKTVLLWTERVFET